MRSLKKNKQSLYYAIYEGKKTIYRRDEEGNIVYADDELKTPVEAGELPSYGKPIPFKANVSAGKGSAHEDVFGKEIDYTKIISTTDISLPIDELSLIWFESSPMLLADGSADSNSADYKVTAIAKSLNNISIAIKLLPKGKA